MKNLLIVYHTGGVKTAQLAEAVARGARAEGGVAVVLKRCAEAGPEDLLAADGLILGTPENFGYMSGALKDFFDRIYYPCLEHTQGLPFAAYIRAGHDGTGTRRALESILTGLRWPLAQEPLTLRGDWQETFVAQAEELGMTVAAGLDAGIL